MISNAAEPEPEATIVAAEKPKTIYQTVALLGPLCAISGAIVFLGVLARIFRSSSLNAAIVFFGYVPAILGFFGLFGFAAALLGLLAKKSKTGGLVFLLFVNLTFVVAALAMVYIGMFLDWKMPRLI